MADETSERTEIEQMRGIVPADGTNGTGSPGETSREVYLRVAGAFPFDIHRGIARLDQASFDALGIKPGALVHLSGQRRPPVRVELSLDGVPGRHVSRRESTLRAPFEVSIDERIKVRV